tara:strand:- start:1866 stop:2060 length:195 start_codon:yes stop_codon:yes gene_type:complete
MKRITNKHSSELKNNSVEIPNKPQPNVQSRIPDIRKNTKAEHYQLGVFDAFALMLTCFNALKTL